VLTGGDDDVGQGVRGAGDVGDLVVVGVPGEGHLEQADGIAAVGDGNDQPGAVRLLLDVHLLRPEDTLVGGARQRDRLRLLHPVTAGSSDPTGRRQPDHGPPAEVGDQEGHRVGVDHLAQRGRHRLHGVDRRCGLDLLQQSADVDHELLRPAHGQTLGACAVAEVTAAGHTTALPGRPSRGGPAAPAKT